MAKSSSENKKIVILMRSTPEFKKRFDAAREYKGWKVQLALERIIEQWIRDIEEEQRDGKKLDSPSKTLLED